ncbi:alkaline phytoceramidase [Penicillium malachiteum]|uniref:alkaline phytoceramidase n=1 Tax=Penicillium malachiteum TaxID=1324776 RepID=UPI002548D733|nr:alkaline phytoceramidase [Penicillium malachiteum]KAJ5736648.1 alkaline phytoceramidase [Penicillium malachiteum]
MSTIDFKDCFWGAPNSNANFCEVDYAVSRYIAEFINSLTNVVYVIYGICGLRRLRRKVNNADSFRVLPYWGLIAVGICSFSFHVSMKYHTQMMDDLSMHFATTPVLHRVLTANSNHRHSVLIGIVLGFLLLFLVTFHMMTDELILHSISFVGAVTIIGIQTFRLVNSRTQPGSASRRQIWGIVKFGAAIFNLGYYFWLVDQWACGYLTKIRDTIGLPWVFILELHGWYVSEDIFLCLKLTGVNRWHICTGIGAYIFIAVVDQLVSGENLEDPKKSIAWPASWAATSIFAGQEPSEDGEVIKKQN